MQNKKGFTLIELLSVIVLISLLLGIGTAGVTIISKNIKKSSLNKKISLVEQAGTLWGQDNKALLQQTTCTFNDKNDEVTTGCYKISIDRLIEEDYLDSESYETPTYTDPVNNGSLLDKCVYIYKKNNRVYAKYSESEDCYINDDEIIITVEKPTITPDKQKNALGWHNEEFILSFSTTTTDAEIFYGFERDEVNIPGNSYEVNEYDAINTLYAKACKNEVCSEISSYEINLDIESPTIEKFSIDSSNSKLQLKVKDEKSGIKEYNIYKDGTVLHSNQTLEETEYNISNSGTYKIRVCDNADNCSEKEVIKNPNFQFVGTTTINCGWSAGRNLNTGDACLKSGLTYLTKTGSYAEITFYTNVEINKVSSIEKVGVNQCVANYSVNSGNSYSCNTAISNFSVNNNNLKFNTINGTSYKHIFPIPRQYPSYGGIYSINIKVTDIYGVEHVLITK